MEGSSRQGVLPGEMKRGADGRPWLPVDASLPLQLNDRQERVRVALDFLVWLVGVG